ncbi:MAG TPA: hypothetical protein VN688_26110 [Gemmataceae bacterium]|nr:hypothetical protein [Gemmataceae bacterium]
MRSLPRIVAFVLLGLVISLPTLGADDKNKKADAKKDDTAKKADVKKPDVKKDKDADTDKPKPTEKWLKVAVVGGKVKGVVEAKKSLRIELTIGKDKKAVEWQAIDDVKVRMLNPPPQFDDKGRIKRYTRKELRELKGEDKSPGYPAEFSDLKPEQYVQVTLVKKKGAPRVTPKRGKDADPDLLGDNLPRMSLIMIVAQPKN